jgi:sigma-B regulation protein RsbU (phosphoserine phosphatase)
MPKILLVDDSEPNRDMLARRLRRNGYDIVTAADGQQAVDLAQSEHPDLILMDLNLPVLDGWRATQCIRESSTTRSIPVVALTAYAMSSDRAKAIEAGCDEYETKPIDLPRLISKMESLLHLEHAASPLAASHSTKAQRQTSPDADEGAVPVSSLAHVLVVDDLADNREMLCRRLERNGFTVDVARDGPQALEMLQSRPYDVVLLDIMMPELSGIDVLKTIRKTQPAAELPVVMATALHASEDVVSALDAGANDYVTKPLDFAVVLARVRTQVSLKRAVEQIRALERDLDRRHQALHAANQQMHDDLQAAAKVQAALLPTTAPTVAGYQFAWLFKPSATLAGDLFNLFRLDDRRIGLFVLDVSGHGVAAALLSVTVSRFLSGSADPSSMLWRQAGGDYELEPPARVAQRLGQRFPFDNQTNQFLTAIYGILDVENHEFRYVSAGHPSLLAFSSNGAATVNKSTGYPIGVEGEDYEEQHFQLDPGSRLYLYSDGITEARNAQGQLFGEKRLIDFLRSANKDPLDKAVQRLGTALKEWTGTDTPGDDQTILAIERQSD